MARYLVERDFPSGWHVPVTLEGSQSIRLMATNNSDDGVTWIHSYVSLDNRKSFCVYDAPNPEAVRRSATRNDLPIDRIVEVRVLDPYFYRP